MAGKSPNAFRDLLRGMTVSDVITPGADILIINSTDHPVDAFRVRPATVYHP